MFKRVAAILSVALLLAVGLTGSAQASSNCSDCKHTFHITDGAGHAIDIALVYDVKSSADSGYKDIGCYQTTIKTNPVVYTDAVQVAIEYTPDSYTTIGTSSPCKLGGTADTNNDVNDGTYTFGGSEPFVSFKNSDTPYLKASVWGLTGASDGRRNLYWALP
jgi:hypothetical protein